MRESKTYLRFMSASAIGIWVFVAAISAQQVVHSFIPTSVVVRVAIMAARDEGYTIGWHGIYLDELRTADGKEPLPGYTSIGLYSSAHPLNDFAIRIDTGDIVDPNACLLFRYPDLVAFGKETRREFGTKEVTEDQIETEVGCDSLKIVPSGAKFP